MNPQHAAKHGTKRFFIAEGSSRTSVEIGDEKLGDGASASVRAVASAHLADLVAKLYRDPLQAERDKIEAMLKNAPTPLFIEGAAARHARFAWPMHVLVDERGSTVGYLMPRIEEAMSRPLQHLYLRSALKTLPVGDSSLRAKVQIARNLAMEIAVLHSLRHYVVDLKPQNIKVFLGSHFVSFLDCDSFCINDESKVYPATHYTAEYIAPEALKYELSPKGLREGQDRFALAVLLFQLLNNGIHPFQGILQSSDDDVPTTDDKVRERLYPYGINGNARIVPLPQSIHRSFDDQTHELFDRAFLAERPSDRPSASEWGDHFDALIDGHAIVACEAHPTDPRHLRFRGKECGVCAFAGAIAKSVKRSSLPLPAPPTVSPSAPIPRAPAGPPTTPAVRRRGALMAGAILAVGGAVALVWHAMLAPTPVIPNVSAAPPGFEAVEDIGQPSHLSFLYLGCRPHDGYRTIRYQMYNGDSVHVKFEVGVALAGSSDYRGWYRQELDPGFGGLLTYNGIGSCANVGPIKIGTRSVERDGP